MHDVFFSYSHKDAEILEPVCRRLESAGIKCWYAPRDIRPGEEWANAITNALQQCKVMILIFSKNSNDSVQVLREAGLAVDYKKTIIPYKVDDTMPGGSMQYYLSTLQWLTASGDAEKDLALLLDLTQKNLSENKTDPQPPAPQAEKKKASKKLIPVLIALFLIAAAGAVLYNIFKKPPEDSKSETALILEDLLGAETLQNLADGTITLGTGEDIYTLDPWLFTKTAMDKNKLYYFSPDLDSDGGDDYLFTLLDDNTIRLNKYNGTGDSEIVIPELIDGLPVTEIGESCFAENTELTAVTLPDTIDYIGESAFEQCTNLSGIRFSKNISVIDHYAFSGSGLVSAELPDSAVEIGESVFYACPSLETVYFPEGIKMIPKGTFWETPELTSVTIAAAKLFIDNDAFDAPEGLTLTGIPGSYTENYARLKNYAFEEYRP